MSDVDRADLIPPGLASPRRALRSRVGRTLTWRSATWAPPARLTAGPSRSPERGRRPRCSRAALSMIARRIASERLSPAACSWINARCVSSSRRTLTADTSLLYHECDTHHVCPSGTRELPRTCSPKPTVGRSIAGPTGRAGVHSSQLPVSVRCASTTAATPLPPCCAPPASTPEPSWNCSGTLGRGRRRTCAATSCPLWRARRRPR